MLAIHQPRSTSPLAPTRAFFVTALAVFTWFGGFGIQSSQAQTQTVVVLDFEVAPGLEPSLGRTAREGLAAQLMRSGDYEVVPRQRVADVLKTEPRLHPPFNDTTQIRLAQVVGADSIISGTVVVAEVTLTAAEVQIDVRQLDSRTFDCINGAQVLERAQRVEPDDTGHTLLNRALSKAILAAIRSMKKTKLAAGTVLGVTAEGARMSISIQGGVAVGQHYSMLREVYNRAKQKTEIVRIGEMRVTHVEPDRSTAVLAAVGCTSVRTGDTARQIFVPQRGRLGKSPIDGWGREM